MSEFCWTVIFKQIKRGEVLVGNGCPSCDGDGWVKSHGFSGPERDGCPAGCNGLSTPGPDLDCAYVKDRSARRFLGVLKLARGEDWTQRWRDLVSENGPGDYEMLSYVDEGLKKPAGLQYYAISFTGEEDIEGWKLFPLDPRLDDGQVADLEACLDKAVAVGNACPAEALAVEYERRGRWEDVRRVATVGMKAPDHDHGIWKLYDESARPLRNIHRRLLSRHNRAARQITGGPGASLYDTVDFGEADPLRECAKCGKNGALGSDAGVMLCHVCRKLPRDQWPKPKPITPFFTNFVSFEKAAPKKREPEKPRKTFKIGSPKTLGLKFKHSRTCSRVHGGKCNACGRLTYFGYGSADYGDDHVVLCKDCLKEHERLAEAHADASGRSDLPRV